MKKTEQVLAELIGDLKVTPELLGFAGLICQLERILELHKQEIKALTPKPKKAVPRKVPVQKYGSLKIEVYENGKTTETIFQTDKEADKFLAMKEKHRRAGRQFSKAFPYGPPLEPRLRKSEDMRAYYAKQREYKEAIEAEKLDMKITITRLAICDQRE